MFQNIKETIDLVMEGYLERTVTYGSHTGKFLVTTLY